MLPMTRRPSATTEGSVEKLLLSSTIWATARVASEPEPMDTPMSASFRAMSFTPSPVIATVWPRDWSAHHVPFLLRGDPPEHRALLLVQRLRHLLLLVGKVARVHDSAAQAELPGHRAHRDRVVAGR